MLKKEENQESISLNKYISESGICSRREADKLIKAGKVTLNGVVAISGNRVTDGDEVLLDDKPLYPNDEKVYIAFNKPKGIVCTTEENVEDNIIRFINYPTRLFPIGRLDKDSEGLILLTNDGDIVNKMIDPANKNETEYLVTINKFISYDFIQQMNAGVTVHNDVTPDCFVEKLDGKIFKIIIPEGHNRHIRSMCQQFEYKVSRLKRIRIMNVRIGPLQTGKWRPLKQAEIDLILKKMERC